MINCFKRDGLNHLWFLFLIIICFKFVFPINFLNHSVINFFVYPLGYLFFIFLFSIKNPLYYIIPHLRWIATLRYHYLNFFTTYFSLLYYFVFFLFEFYFHFLKLFLLWMIIDYCYFWFNYHLFQYLILYLYC